MVQNEHLEEEILRGWPLYVFLITSTSWVSGMAWCNFSRNSGPAWLLYSRMELAASSGEGNGNPLQYSCLENPINRGVWWAMTHGVAVLDRFNYWACKHTVASRHLGLEPRSWLGNFPPFIFFRHLCSVVQLCPTLWDPMDYSQPGSTVHWGFSGKNTGVGCYFLLQEIFPNQGSNPSFLHLLPCGQILYPLSHWGSFR